MALGRAETIYELTGKPVCITCNIGIPRDHPAWHGNPAWDKNAQQFITDTGGGRGYIKEWRGNQVIFNYNYKARAGRVYGLPEINPPAERYAVVSPHLKDKASPNKNWGFERWAEVIKNFPIPVYQLSADHAERLLPGAQLLTTPNFRDAMAVIQHSALVLTNEGGPHHMAASLKRPAVVIFGSFTPPEVTGYDFHENMAVETDEGYCGRYSPCDHCKKSLASITPAMVKEKAMMILGEK